ncbi:MAG: Unknown protein [uncultured Thiotrichaceae bacterium]|uniref:DUF4760 domain-containing protein n=1 Tax=uncultured Thiotrichaceae bacterium TaxID=298394 RepID=A0A6S6RZZ0_9GAMM|nr:MAG: Unknown protein [uncultured Thiotrichaceae bacterium]
MIRLFLYALLALISTFVLALLTYLTWKLIKWLRAIMRQGEGVIESQKEYWRWRRSRKGKPDYYLKGDEVYSRIRVLCKKLPEPWFAETRVMIEMSDKLFRLAQETEDHGKPFRRFFTVTLPAMESFMVALVEDRSVMKAAEEAMARKNIAVFERDLQVYFDKGGSSRRLNFHILMEVIRQRLRR